MGGAQEKPQPDGWGWKHLRLFRGLRDGAAQACVGVFHSNHFGASERYESNAARRRAVNPIFDLDAVLGLARFSAGPAQREKHLVAIHPDDRFLFRNGYLDFGSNGVDVLLGHPAAFEL